MIPLYIILFVLIAVIAMVFSYFVGLRTVGIKASLSNVFKLTIVLLVLQGLATFLSYLIGNNPAAIIIGLSWLIGAFIAWHKLLNRYYHVNIGKSLGAYIIGGIIASILAVVFSMVVTNYVQAFRVSGNAMNPTLQNNDTVLAFKKGKELEVNKVVVYNYKMNDDIGITIGRILYTPGQTVSIKTTYVDTNGAFAQPSDYTLKDGEYYIFGDNKQNSIPRIVKTQNIVAVVGPTILKAD